MTAPPTAPVFVCSICAEPSRSICAWCTKDACDNHLCDQCRRCSDCCGCGLSLDAEPASGATAELS